MNIGIDLGTTHSTISLFENGKTIIIPDENGKRSIPSLVLITPNDEIFVGSMARNHPERYNGLAVLIYSHPPP